jgi:hypothetical protein
MPVAEIDRGLYRTAVELAQALDIRHPGTRCGRDDHRKRMMDGRDVGIFSGDVLGG